MTLALALLLSFQAASPVAALPTAALPAAALPAAALPAPVPLVLAQPADTLRLVALRAAAEARDPRQIQPELLARASALRLANLRASRLPTLALTGQATAQSDAPTVPAPAPDGTPLSAPREQARVQIEADWAVFDGGRTGLQADLERARLAEQTAGVAVTLYGLRQATTDAFFAALLSQTQAATLALTADDLDARLVVLLAQVRNGAALEADASVVEAELIRVRQQTAEATANRRAALAVLSDLTDTAIGADAVLMLPDLDGATARLERLDARRRPEFERFERTGDRASAEARLALAATRPTVSLFGQLGVGRPSPFDFLSRDVAEYAQAGIRVRWAPVDYGQARRAAEAALVQADVAQTEADAFARTLARQSEADRADIERLSAARDLDARAVRLRDEVLRVARRQLDEGVLPVPQYVDRVTDLADARLTADRHRTELARAQARLLTTLGLFPDDSTDR